MTPTTYPRTPALNKRAGVRFLWVHGLLLCGLLGSLLLSRTPLLQAAGNVGYQGPSYANGSGSPSGSKPESKLWWNDGFWWASMWDTATADFYIYKLDLASQTWIKTPTRLDDRAGSRADALWDQAAQKLYVASHSFTESSIPGSASVAGKLWRFSYTPATDTYILDAGFPVVINQASTETLVIDKDSTGTLWATWVQPAPTGGYRVYVNHTLGNDAIWATPFPLPVLGTTVASDDISSLVHFDGNKIGVMWSNQREMTMNFSVHADGEPTASWQARSVAFGGSGSGNADDHINLKSLQSDSQGRVFAAVKTSLDGSNDPLVVLLVYNRSTNQWSHAVFGVVSDEHTRPIVLLDQTNNVVHMFATSDENGGSIYRKTTPLSSPFFVPGLGTPFIEEAATPGQSGDLNNATSTKQAVNCTTGIVVLASNDTTNRYWHNYEAIPGCGTQPTATATTTSVPTATATTTSVPTVTATSTPPTANPRRVFLPLVNR